MFEKVIILNNGKIVAVENTEDFVASFSFVSGREEDVDAVTAGHEVLHRAHGPPEGRGRALARAVMEQAAAGQDVDISPSACRKHLSISRARGAP